MIASGTGTEKPRHTERRVTRLGRSQLRARDVGICTAIAVAWTLIASPVHAEVYTWVDAQGNLHISDRPVGGAKDLETVFPIREALIQSPHPSRSAQRTFQLSSVKLGHGSEALALEPCEGRPAHAIA